MLYALILSAALGADPAPPVVVEVPPPPGQWVEVAVPVGKRVKLTPTDGKPASFVLIDDAEARLDETGGVAFFWCPRPGTYKVVLYQADRGFTRISVVGQGVAPPGPKKPDEPPTPPAPPAPGDPLAAKVKAAFDACPEPDKDETRKDLIAFFKVAKNLAQDPGVATTADLLTRVVAASGLMVGKDRLNAVRTLFNAELDAAFADDGPLTQEKRNAAATLFERFRTTLNW